MMKILTDSTRKSKKYLSLAADRYPVDKIPNSD